MKDLFEWMVCVDGDVVQFEVCSKLPCAYDQCVCQLFNVRVSHFDIPEYPTNEVDWQLLFLDSLIRAKATAYFETDRYM